MIVIDASALTDLLLERAQAVAMLSEELSTDGQEPLHAPELVDLEILNALRRLVLSGRVSAPRATAAVGHLASARLIRYPHASLRERVWELRDELSAYDAAYLALAEGLHDSLLVTGDAGLALRARISLGGGRVRQIV